MSLWTSAIAVAGLLACEAAPARVPAQRELDKEALFGDPALVPTRAGERAREELALAGSVRAALRARAGDGALAVEVRLPTGDDPGAAVIAGELAVDAETALRIAEGVLGPWSAGRVQVWLAPARAPASDARSGGLSWALALALAGLGVSAGVSIERLRQRR
jgi:hypothetical protein